MKYALLAGCGTQIHTLRTDFGGKAEIYAGKSIPHKELQENNLCRLHRIFLRVYRSKNAGVVDYVETF